MTPEERMAIAKRENPFTKKDNPEDIQKPEEWETPAAFNQYELPVFPIETLTDWQATFAKGLATTTQTPLDMAAMLTLTNTAAAIAGKVVIEAKANWRETTNLYTAVILDVGERKTAVHDFCKAPLEEHEEQLIRDKTPDIKNAQLERGMKQKRIDHLKDKAAKSDDPIKRKLFFEEAKTEQAEMEAILVPAYPRMLATGDITPEAIGTQLAEQEGRLFISSDEGELFELLAGRYGGAPNFEVVLKAHTGAKLRVDRRSRSEVVPSATLTIAMTVQPDVIRALADKRGFRGRGLTARFLFILPTSLVGGRESDPAPLTEDAKKDYGHCLKTLAKLEKVQVNDKPAPRVILLSETAKTYLTDFRKKLEPQLGEGGKLRHIGDWANKLPGAIVRIAGILHCADNALSLSSMGDITGAVMNRAIQIGRYLIPHAQAAFAEMGADEDVELAKRILRWIEANPLKDKDIYLFHKQALWQSVKGGAIKKTSDLDRGLTILEEHFYIKPLPSSSRGHRPKVVYEVNPSIFTSPPNSPKTPKSSDDQLGELGELGEKLKTEHAGNGKAMDCPHCGKSPCECGEMPF